MRYTQVQLGPEFTPKAIRNLIVFTLGISLLSAFFEPIFYSLIGDSGPQEWLSLSSYGLTHLMWWQPFTYIFVFPEGYGGISFNLLLSLVFQMYLLWVVGTMIYHRVGSRPFLQFYFLVAVFSGLLTTLMGSTILAGPGAVIMALITVWMMCSPEMEILLLLIFPVKVKWIALGTIGAIFLVYLSQLDFIHMTFYLSGALIGYIYAGIAWGMVSPFSWTKSFDKQLHAINHRWHLKRRQTEDTSKIINFKTGQPEMENDDRFVDVMLTKISKYGEKSLTWSERRRLDTISKKKAKKR